MKFSFEEKSNINERKDRKELPKKLVEEGGFSEESREADDVERLHEEDIEDRKMRGINTGVEIPVGEITEDTSFETLIAGEEDVDDPAEIEEPENEFIIAYGGRTHDMPYDIRRILRESAVPDPEWERMSFREQDVHKQAVKNKIQAWYLARGAKNIERSNARKNHGERKAA